MANSHCMWMLKVHKCLINKMNSKVILMILRFCIYSYICILLKDQNNLEKKIYNQQTVQRQIMGNIDNCIDFKQQQVMNQEKKQRKIVFNAPDTKYALRMKNQFPKLPQRIQRVKNANGIQQINDIVKDSPIYYIYQKNSIYQGHWKQGLPHGYGRILYSDFSYYQGLLVDGEPNTYITDDHHEDAFFIHQDGSFYKGQFRNSKFQGKGKFVSKNNDVKITGNFKNGYPHGRIVQVFSTTNERYEGQFQNGVKSGQGKYYINDRLLYQGQFKDGNFHGEGRMIDQNGNQFVGKFQAGKKIQGHTISYEGNICGEYLGDKGHGYYEWKDGKFYIGQFQKNVFHGQGKIYHENGRVIEGIWKNGSNVYVKNLIDKDPKQVMQIKKKYKKQLFTSNNKIKNQQAFQGREQKTSYQYL